MGWMLKRFCALVSTENAAGSFLTIGGLNFDFGGVIGMMRVSGNGFPQIVQERGVGNLAAAHIVDAGFAEPNESGGGD